MNKSIVFIVSFFLVSTLCAQVVDRDYSPSEDFVFCSDFNNIQDWYKDTLFIHISIPRNFKLKCGYGACYSYSIPTGTEYVAVLTSKDNHCKVFIPAIRKGSHLSVESIMQSDFKHKKGYIEYVTKTFGYQPHLCFNADTVYSYTIPETIFYNDYGNNSENVSALTQYPNNERVILFKKGQVPLPLLFVFTNKGYTNKDFYIKSMEHHFFFIKPKSLLQLWGLS